VSDDSVQEVVDDYDKWPGPEEYAAPKLTAVLAWYGRQMRARGVPGGKSGAVTVVQRVSSDLRLNPHMHSLLLDGVFAEDEGGELVFHPLSFLIWNGRRPRRLTWVALSGDTRALWHVGTRG
jgi:hypothetical protein